MTSSVEEDSSDLSERQQAVLRAVVAGYLGQTAPVGSTTVSHLLPFTVSSATIRNTMAELTQQGLLEKRHASAGRVPTESGLRFFLDKLLETGEVGAWDRRQLDQAFEGFDDLTASDALQIASDLIGQHTGQLGFVMRPRLKTLVVRHLSLVRVSSERVLVVLVSHIGEAHQRVIECPGSRDQPELDRIAALLIERMVGRTLGEVRGQLDTELRELRSQAGRIVRRALELGIQVVSASSTALSRAESEIVIATHLALLDQPDFQDPNRLREVLTALDSKEQLVGVLDRILADEVAVALGEELEETGLQHCALIVARTGDERSASGALGVIGSHRMDYARIIPLVAYCSQRVTERLSS